jgi:hypothetical protein
MSTPIPPPSAPDPNNRNQPPELYSQTAAGHGGGCLSIFLGTIAGFVLFVVGGSLALSLDRQGKAGIPYLVLSFCVAVVLTMKATTRGLAIGIFLGLGAVLLVLAICSGFHIN